MIEVFVTARGHVWHATVNCEWLQHAKANARSVGRRVHPTRKIMRADTKRPPCRVCVPKHEPCL